MVDRGFGRILFVEDHPDVREALASLMEDCGYEVTSVCTAEEGMERLESNEPFDLLVTDHSLPGESGAWLLQEAVGRGLLDRARALIVTALPNPPGCEGFTVLRKPLDVSAFVREVSYKLSGARRAERSTSSSTAEPARVQLALYMSSGSSHSHRALKSLEGVLSAMDPSCFQLEICDLSRGSHDLAERDKVSYTPTLVKRAPAPRSWVVGDLRDQDRLLAVLGAWGVTPKEPGAAR